MTTKIANREQCLKALLLKRILFLDGAMGTMIQAYKLEEDDYRGERFADWSSDLKGNNDLLSLTQPAIIKAIHSAYLDAGADIIETNTFNATPIAMADYSMESLSFEMNVASASLAREAADAAELKTPEKPRFVAGVETLADEFRKNGGQIVRAEVRDIEIGAEGPSRLVTDGDAIDLDALVIAAGALSAKFCKRLGTPVPLVGERGYHVTLPDPGISTDMPVMSGDCHFAMTTMEMGLRCAGTAEFSGLEAPPSYNRARVLLKHVKRIFPTINTEGYSEWMGMRPSLPDTLPVIGASPNFSSTFFAFGHGHAGLMGSVITGRAIADLLASRTPVLDLTPFRVSRF